MSKLAGGRGRYVGPDAVVSTNQWLSERGKKAKEQRWEVRSTYVDTPIKEGEALWCREAVTVQLPKVSRLHIGVELIIINDSLGIVTVVPKAGGTVEGSSTASLVGGVRGHFVAIDEDTWMLS